METFQNVPSFSQRMTVWTSSVQLVGRHCHIADKLMELKETSVRMLIIFSSFLSACIKLHLTHFYYGWFVCDSKNVPVRFLF